MMDLTRLLFHPAVPALMFAVAMLIAIPGVLSFVRSDRSKKAIHRRLDQKRVPKEGSVEGGSAIDRAMVEIGQQNAGGNSAPANKARARLTKAGILHPQAVGRYYFASLLTLVLPQIGLLMALPYLGDVGTMKLVLASGGLAVVGLLAPSFWLDGQIKKRRRSCSLGFPDMMDLLAACVEAGLSLDAAVQRVGEELEKRHPIIAGHLRTLSLELRAGRARKVAWRSFADRMDIDEAGSLATMLRQAEEMGTSLGQTLRIFSIDMRKRRILYAEEKAMALPAKLTVPLIFFIFPVLLGVLVLPMTVKLRVLGM